MARGLAVRLAQKVPERWRGDLPNTELLPGISDEQLRDEYRRAHALFLPLQLSTANNVVLEAMSCGTPVVSTPIGGMPEYVSADAGILVAPGDGRPRKRSARWRPTRRG